MRKLILTISILVLSTTLAWVASAQEEARTYRLGYESDLSWFVNGIAHLGGEIYLTDKLGINAGVGTYYTPLPSSYFFDGGYTAIGAAYYFNGVANSSGYVHVYVARWNAEISRSISSSNAHTLIVDDTTHSARSTSNERIGEAAWENFGVVVGHRWQGKRWYLRTGLGYAESEDIAVVLESTDGRNETVILNSHNGAMRTLDKSAFARGFISNIALGIAF